MWLYLQGSDGQRRRVAYVCDQQGVWVATCLGASFWPYSHAAATTSQATSSPSSLSCASGSITAPLGGRVVELVAKLHQPIAQGEVLLRLELMKMEQAVLAPQPLQVVAWLCREQDVVAAGSPLLQFVGITSE